MSKKNIKNQPSKVQFKPEHFGAYNLFMWLTGIFMGLSFGKSWWFLIGVLPSFLLACHFYAKSQNYYTKLESEYIELDEERSNIYK